MNYTGMQHFDFFLTHRNYFCYFTSQSHDSFTLSHDSVVGCHIVTVRKEASVSVGVTYVTNVT